MRTFCCWKRGPRFKECNLLVKNAGICVFFACQAKNTVCSVPAVILRTCGIAYRANCDEVFRWVPLAVNYSDRGSRVYDADCDLLSVCSTVCVFSNGSPGHHQLCTRHRPCHHMTVRLVNPVDQSITAETPVSRVPQTIVSGVDRQSDAESPVLDLESVSAGD